MPHLLPTAFLLAAASTLAAQQFTPIEIHVDGRCRIFTQDRPGPGTHYSKPGFHRDSSLCHFESEHSTHHWEQNVENGVVNRTYVSIKEHEYLLHDPTAEPVVFIIDQALPEGWRVDSDPQPVEVSNHIATFRVFAQPGQTIRLHIGERK